MMRLRSVGVVSLALVAWASVTLGEEVLRIPLTLPSGKVLRVEVASSPETRALGLMYREKLPNDEGMLFLFEEQEFHGFWMKNCKIAIDIVWMDSERRVVHLAERVPPCRRDPCPSYVPMRQASFVLEMSAGQARREGVQIGARLDFQVTR
jgi:uncharacterized membrane protein (UPF0127 family)